MSLRISSTCFVSHIPFTVDVIMNEQHNLDVSKNVHITGGLFNNSENINIYGGNFTSIINAQGLEEHWRDVYTHS